MMMLRTHVEQNGHDWEEELDNFYVAEGLHEALVQAKAQAVFHRLLSVLRR